MAPGGMLGRLPHALPGRPVLQIIISTNKEQVLNEKKMTVGFGTTVVTGHSEVIQSGEYDDFEVFFNKVTSTWGEIWANVYGANPAGGWQGWLRCLRGVCRVRRVCSGLTAGRSHRSACVAVARCC
jgi:hypothetical protein